MGGEREQGDTGLGEGRGMVTKNLDNQDKEYFNTVFLKIKVNVSKLQVEQNKAVISVELCDAVLCW